jgi:hypothetical protein
MINPKAEGYYWCREKQNLNHYSEIVYYYGGKYPAVELLGEPGTQDARDYIFLSFLGAAYIETESATQQQ